MRKLLDKLELLFKSAAEETSLHRFYLKKYIKKFAQQIEVDQPVILDIGSATAPYKSLFTFKDYISIDIDAQRGDINIIGNILNLPIRENAIDVVICTEVLEHVNDTEKAFLQINRVCKKEGYLILTIPFLIGVHDSIDFYRFTETALRKLLTAYGFEILILKERGGIFSLLGSIFSQLPYQLFGPYSNNRNYIKFTIIFFYYLILIPLMKIFLLLDKLDKKKHFTIGYCVLARKVA